MKSLVRKPLAWAILIAGVAYLLGYFGYRALATETVSPSNALYRAMQLFAVDENAPSGPKPWQLEIARFAAPLSVAFATALAVATYLRDNVRRALLVVTAREHVVLVGLGDTGAALTVRLREQGHRVVVIDSDPSNPRIAGVNAVGGTVVVGDARQSVILRKAQTGRAAHVVVSTGDDARNLHVAELLRAAGADEPNGSQTIHVAIADPALWAELGTLHLSTTNGVSVEHFCRVDRAAQALLDEAERVTGGLVDDYYVDGDGPLLARTVTHLVRRSIVTGRDCRVTASPAAGAALSRLVESEPWLAAAVPRSRSADMEVAACALVCTDAGDATALTRAIAASRAPGRQAVVVSLTGLVSAATLESVRRGLASVTPVTIDSATLSRDIIGRSGIEVMAQARHDDYLARERAHGDPANPSLIAWGELPSSLQQSNRRFAEAVGAIVDAAGGRLVPLVGPVPDASWIDATRLESMAVDEHDRWVAALVTDGWTYGPAPKNAQRKTQPLIVAWDDLAPAEQEKDRDAIRAIPGMLARVGYAIQMP